MSSMFLSERIASLLIALAVIPATGRDATLQDFEDYSRPRVPVHSVYAPRFRTQHGDVVGGTGFLVRVAGESTPLFLTTHQPFTAAAGLDRDYSPAELTMLVQGMEAHSIDDASRTLSGEPGPTIVGARATRGESAWRDLAAFSVTAGGGPALGLAARGPRNGQRIWLYARSTDGAHASALVPAIVERSTTSSIGYRFDDPNLRLGAARGAPLVDAEGRVVAMHVDEQIDQGYLRGIGNPVDSIRRLIERAMERGELTADARLAF